MPLVRIDLIAGKPADFRRDLGETIYQAMLQTISMPANDRFQVINEHPAENFIAHPTYLGISRTPDCIFIQITLNKGRTLEIKKALYLGITDGLHQRLGLRREDVLINLVEVDKENWSFGNGLAQYA